MVPKDQPMRFLCDEMLKGVARWLRVAGYDVVVEDDRTRDQVLLERAIKEGRILLTRDKKFAQSPPGDANIVLLDCEDLAECFRELRDRLGVDWLHRPFSRCLACNTPLVEVGQDRWNEVPGFSREQASRLLLCPSCNQLFWDGSHVARMHERLKAAMRQQDQ
jgi:uncharacterized protein with PIN domain